MFSQTLMMTIVAGTDCSFGGFFKGSRRGSRPHAVSQDRTPSCKFSKQPTEVAVPRTNAPPRREQPLCMTDCRVKIETSPTRCLGSAFFRVAWRTKGDGGEFFGVFNMDVKVSRHGPKMVVCAFSSSSKLRLHFWGLASKFLRDKRMSAIFTREDIFDDYRPFFFGHVNSCEILRMIYVALFCFWDEIDILSHWDVTVFV